MGALFDHPTLREDDDVVEFDDGREPVSDQHHGAVPRQPAERREHGGFRLRVEGGGRLVQDEDRGAPHESPGQRDSLPLSAGDTGATLPDGRLVALGQALHDLVDAGVPGGGLDLVVGGIRSAEPDVLPDRQVEEVALLEHDAELIPQGRLRDVADVAPVEGHRALLGS